MTASGAATPSSNWADIAGALHLWRQIVLKHRPRHPPWVNTSCHTTLYVAPRGMATGRMHETTPAHVPFR
ncbi:MAG: DUF5996 family protein [Pseudomonadota bacterium]